MKAAFLSFLVMMFGGLPVNMRGAGAETPPAFGSNDDYQVDRAVDHIEKIAADFLASTNKYQRAGMWSDLDPVLVELDRHHALWVTNTSIPPRLTRAVLTIFPGLTNSSLAGPKPGEQLWCNALHLLASTHDPDAVRYLQPYLADHELAGDPAGYGAGITPLRACDEAAMAISTLLGLEQDYNYILGNELFVSRVRTNGTTVIAGKVHDRKSGKMVAWQNFDPSWPVFDEEIAYLQSRLASDPATGGIYTNAGYGFSFEIPKEWKVTETNYEVFHYNEVFLTINSQRPDLTMREQMVATNTYEFGSNIALQELQPGEVNVSIGYFDGPGGSTMRQDEVDLDLYRQLADHPIMRSVNGLSCLELRFFKWGHEWDISAYLRDPLTDESRQKLLYLLRSFRFLNDATNNISRIESLAWWRMTVLQPGFRWADQWPVVDYVGQKPRYGPRSVQVQKEGPRYTVEFKIDDVGSWKYLVSSDGTSELAVPPGQKHGRPDSLMHDWEYVSYPWSQAHERNWPTFIIGWPGRYSHADENSRGLPLAILDITQGFSFFKTNSIKAQIFRANGEVTGPTVEGEKLLKSPAAAGNFSVPGHEPAPQVMTYFPWGTNILEESWIRVEIGLEKYWIEVPYGFDRNPDNGLSLSDHDAQTHFFPPVKLSKKHDHVVHWAEAKYDLGAIENNWRLEVDVTNCPTARCQVVLYKEDEKSWDATTPNVTASILNPDGSVQEGKGIDMNLHDDFMRRKDTFDFGTRINASPGWGQIRVNVDGQISRIMVPASIYQAN